MRTPRASVAGYRNICSIGTICDHSTESKHREHSATTSTSAVPLTQIPSTTDSTETSISMGDSSGTRAMATPRSPGAGNSKLNSRREPGCRCSRETSIVVGLSPGDSWTGDREPLTASNPRVPVPPPHRRIHHLRPEQGLHTSGCECARDRGRPSATSSAK